jgi:hypothetical protein
MQLHDQRCSEANNRSPTQEITRLLRNPKFRYCFEKSQLLVQYHSDTILV